MATVAGIKIKTKVPRVARVAFADEKYTGPEPEWTAESADWDNERFDNQLRKSFYYYNYYYSQKDCKKYVIEWLQKNSKLSIEEVKAFNRAGDRLLPMTVCSLIMAHRAGMPFRGRHIEFIIDSVMDVVAKAEPEVLDAIATPEQISYRPTIQDRLKDAAGDMGEEIDYAIDTWITDPDAFDPKAFKMTNLLRGKGAKAAHARFIKAYFKSGQDELLELASGNADEQLREAYSHVARKNVKKLIDFYESIMTACDQIAAEAKLNKKPRAKKVVPAEKLVAKLKFKASDDKLGLTSVPPTQLVGAQGAVVYNAKTRKIGIYTAKTSAGLAIKGTSILEFTVKSTQKTLRKPEVQLREFKEQNTNKRIEAWFAKIKATETVMNGRMNEEIMILKVFK